MKLFIFSFVCGWGLDPPSCTSAMSSSGNWPPQASTWAHHVGTGAQPTLLFFHSIKRFNWLTMSENYGNSHKIDRLTAGQNGHLPPLPATSHSCPEQNLRNVVLFGNSSLNPGIWHPSCSHISAEKKLRGHSQDHNSLISRGLEHIDSRIWSDLSKSLQLNTAKSGVQTFNWRKPQRALPNHGFVGFRQPEKQCRQGGSLFSVTN